LEFPSWKTEKKNTNNSEGVADYGELEKKGGGVDFYTENSGKGELRCLSNDNGRPTGTTLPRVSRSG